MAFPIAAAALGLVGSLAVMLVLHRSATSTLDRMLDERLLAAGDSAALLLSGRAPDSALLARLMGADGLDGAYLVDANLTVLADATRPSPRPADLFRVDEDRMARAWAGEASVGPDAVGELTVMSGYFPVRGPGSEVRAVLALEAGKRFASARRQVGQALWLGLLLAGLAAGGLGVAAAAFVRAERERRGVEARAARAETVSRMAAVAAHEIRNPLAVIRGTVDMMKERSPALSEAQRSSLDDVLAEVIRLRRLTDDLLDLSADRPLSRSRIQLDEVLDEVSKAAAASHPGLAVERALCKAAVEGDPARLRQVFANLLDNAAQAKAGGAVRVELSAQEGFARCRVHDDGPGIPPELRDRLFEPFFTTKTQGTGLGLALAKRLVERHGGTVRLLEVERGSTFEVRLPLSKDEEG